jgi:hypothetical protein
MAILGYNTFTQANDAEIKKPSYREPHNMDPRSWLRDLTPYFLYLLFVTTIGPLLFGYHLVRLNCILPLLPLLPMYLYPARLN